jgi:hypothetical protein
MRQDARWLGLFFTIAILGPTPCRRARADDAATADAKAASPSDALARSIDAYLDGRCAKEAVAAAPPADDAEFLRRVHLDVVGDSPRPDEVIAFLAQQDTDKRRRKVDELLARDEAARNWAEFWTDVLDRDATTKIREDQFKQGLRTWFEGEFKRGAPFDEVVRKLVAAEGELKDNGAIGFVLSYLDDKRQPDAKALAATTARVFMGLQIECAQCHDHPFADWKRDDFMGLAAFFARARSYKETPPIDRKALRRMSQEERDKKITELKKLIALLLPKISEADSGELEVEVQTVRNPGDKRVPPPPRDARAGNGGDPAKYVVAPRFIVPALATVSPGASAGNRREALGRLITSDQDPYFAKCCANRIWGHLTGRPLVAPSEDMSDENAPHDPQLLAILAKGFRDLRYDHKAFVRAICLTAAYGRSSRSSADTTDKEQLAKLVKAESLYAQGVVRPIDSRPLARALVTASFLGDFDLDRLEGMGEETILRRFERIFGEANLDPKKYEESIPQALFMMNGPGGGGAGPYGAAGGAKGPLAGKAGMGQKGASGTPTSLEVRRRNAVKRLLARVDDPRERVTRLYVSALARPPRPLEIADALSYLQGLTGEEEAVGYEDLLWALVNSAEFRFNR